MDPLYERLREVGWRRKLTPPEQQQLLAWLEQHPEARAEWDSEAALTGLLGGLPDVPVASNFTARVVDAAKAEPAGEARRRSELVRPWWRAWLPKAALGALLLTTGLLSYEHFQATRRAELAHSLAAVSEVPSLPSPEILKDFDTIAALSSAPPADEELLRVMQ